MKTMTSEDIDFIKKEIIRIYSKDFFSKMYTKLRLILAPMIQMIQYIPEKGDILDLGCGNGIVANILSIGTPERKVYGVDLSSDRIEAAKRISQDNPNLQFVAGDVNTVSFERFDIVTLIDLLHHMPYREQDALLNKIYNKLNEGDLLIIKDLEKSPCWKYIFHYIQDSLSYRERLYFRSAVEMEGILGKAGFQVETVSLADGYPHPHVLYSCKKGRRS